mmetsp:Transcript_66810/g.139234  ORF Transcript_66810/g.139234 Transcript_66810/m.139234 type:complete len:205 (+) Transcript_66810:1227-1841(+)
MHALLLAEHHELGVLHPVADPVALVLGGHVHVLHAHGGAVGLLQAGDDLPQGHVGPRLPQDLQVARVAPRAAAQHVQRAVHVLFFEPVVAVVQLGRGRRASEGVEAKGVEIGQLVAAHLVGADQVRQRKRVRALAHNRSTGLSPHRGSELGSRGAGSRSRHEGVGHALVRVGEVGCPGGVHTLGVLDPCTVHLINVDSIGAAEK